MNDELHADPIKHSFPTMFPNGADLWPRLRAWIVVTMLPFTLGALAGPAPRTFDLAAGDAAETLKQFAAQAQREIIFPAGPIAGVRTLAVRGNLPPNEALSRMIVDTGLTYVEDSKTGAFVVNRAAPPGPSSAGSSRSAQNASPESHPKEMKPRFPLAIIASWLGLMLSPAPAAENQDGASHGTAALGTIRGVVVDQSTGDPMENARVVLGGTSLSTFTGRDGTFVLRSVPPGEHVVVASYTGFDSASQPLQTRPGEDVPVRLALASGVIQLEAYRVTDFRRGDADEIMRRRHATNVMDVISSKTFGEMPDGMLSDAVKRLPGMTGGAGIRGVHGEFNLVRVDGAAFATPSVSGTDGSTRESNIDLIPGDMIERIEVTKTPKPDMDGDAVGGTINLITKSPLDRGGRSTSYSIGGVYSPNYNDPKVGYSFNLNHSDVIGTKGKLGYSISLNHNRRWSNLERIQTEWMWDTVQGMPIDGPRPNGTTAFRVEENLEKRDRTGGGVKLEFKAGENAVLYVNTLFQRELAHSDLRNWSITTRDRLLEFDEEGQFWYAPVRVRSGRGNADGRVASYDSDGNIIPGTEGRGESGVLPTFDGFHTDILAAREWRTQQRLQEQYRSTYTGQIGGRHNGFKDTKIDFSASFSRGRAKRDESPDHLGGTMVMDIGGSNVRIDRTKDMWFPDPIWTGGTDPSNLRNAFFNRLNQLDALQIEDLIGAEMNAERALRTRIPVSIKTGFRYRHASQDIHRWEQEWNYMGEDLERFVGDASINPFGRYAAANIPSTALSYQSVLSEPELWEENVERTIQKRHEHTGTVEESILGTYLMSDVRLGRLTVLPGVRMEWTRTKGTGVVQQDAPDLTPEEEWSGRRTDQGRYRTVFPHLHFRYEARDDLIIRASWTTGIGRPSWRNIIPHGSINPIDEEINMTNTNLRPQYSNNFDISAEYYIEPAGVIAINVFHKEIDDLIFSSRRTITSADTDWDPIYQGWELSTSDNAAWAWVKGVEFDYRQQLTFLPGWLKGFGIFANLTLLDTAGNYSSTDGSVTSDIPGFVPKMWNAGISYSGQGLSIRVQAHHKDEHLEDWDDRTHERWKFDEALTIVDLRASYRINRRMNLFLNIGNLFEASTRTYQFRPSQPYSTDQASMRIDFGVRGSL